ncbi:MAG: efflux RND transporter periplasmic adaptor subunit [Acidobacteriota bacterium]
MLNKKILLAAALTIAVVAGLWSLGSSKSRPASAEDRAAPELRPAAPSPTDLAPPVTIVTVQPTTARPSVLAFGEARAQYRTIIAAETAGSLTTIAPDAHSGGRLARGAVLMTLDGSRQLEALADARAKLGQARVRLAEEELRAQQAKLDWQRIGSDEPATEFLLRQPQRESARLDVEAAEAALVEAQRDLDRTEIRAPFDATVVRRIAALGSYVEPGNELIELDSTRQVEIRLPLKASDWALLPPEKELLAEGWPVDLTTTDSPPRRWQGRVDRIEQHVVRESRQRTLVAIVDRPLEQEFPLFPGTFLRATLAGRSVDGVLELPASAITEQQEIWLVDAEGFLEKAPVDPLFAADGRALVPFATDSEDGLKVVLHPMASFLPGLAVRSVDSHDNR